MSSYVATKRASSIGAPSKEMRSRIECRCGLVNRPVRMPKPWKSASIIRAVVVLPLVPVTCTTGYARCGSPSSSTTARMRSSDGTRSCSGAFARMAASTSRIRAESSSRVGSGIRQRAELGLDPGDVLLRAGQLRAHLVDDGGRCLAEERLVAELGQGARPLGLGGSEVLLQPRPLLVEVDRAPEVELDDDVADRQRRDRGEPLPRLGQARQRAHGLLV